MTMLAIRVHNITRSCILMRQFITGMWTLPMTTIPVGADPLYYLDDLLKQVEGKFELISALSMVDYVDKELNGDSRHSIVYDIKYRGRIHSTSPAGYKDRYTKSQWMQIDAIKKQAIISHPTEALLVAIESDVNLK